MNINQGNICGERIKALRKKNNLTQCQLAELLHMSRSTVLKYETGRQIPPVDRICDIADIFNVSTDYLYGLTDFDAPLSILNEIFCKDVTYAEVISMILDLPEELQKAVMVIAEYLGKK
ncbi:helix-turn-helix domain-containing protein [Ruminococcus flavefaciens]|uniref:helix-turn-helix domain-containing protein n=1 Tax=Ruminococcus flavefaciens TaxID=1265 RepID=UPI0026ED7542|nr:helix-turn-helix domain-containing protein [Ruminococcus flavefaciens]